ncbi:hypothetical protein CHISP_3566 [Chitinispirillum alkaliphilum]|nr:hypothetical protein CHISP_3566 [Chitinispirillum alkaliphilum]
MITGNAPVHAERWGADEFFGGLGKTQRLSRWTPSGRITFQDDILGVQPVVDVRIRYGRWYSFRTVRTNSRGEFSGRRRRTKARYKIEWRANDFKLKKHSSIRKSYSKSVWNKHLTGKDALCAVVWVAAREYFYGDIDGLSRPRKKTARLRINVRDDSHDEGWLGYHRAWLIGTKVEMFLKRNGVYRSPSQVYAVAVHELAHNAHYRNFEKISDRWTRDREWRKEIESIIKESFATGIEWYFCIKRYGKNTLEFNYSTDYTGIVEDLIDTDISYASRGGGFAPGNLRNKTERVSGFTIKQIENALFKSNTWNQFRDNLKADYPSRSGGPRYTEREIDNLFANWGNI